MRRVYLDHAATTPVRKEVVDVMTRYMLDVFGNPSSIHQFGREARKGMEEAREHVASLVGAQPEEIVFTSGGTESDNMAVRGVAEALEKKGNHIITSAIEHHAILHTCEYLEKHRGYEVTYLPVDYFGMVSPDDVRAAIRPSTVLVTVMMANNEVGTIQRLAEIGLVCREAEVTFHSDAVQAAGAIPVDVEDLAVDLMSLSGHKMYGPKGVGALYIRKGTKIRPIAYGGAHEKQRRPGTEGVPGIVGLGEAARLARAEMDSRVSHVRYLRDRLISGLLEVEETRLNGHPSHRLPNNSNVSVAYVEGESMLLNLDMAGIGCSSGSACTSGSLEPSHVLLAMGLDHEEAHGSLRMTLGYENTVEDVDYVIGVFPGIVKRLREMSPLARKGEPR
ncbi:MAG: cysteine desulfurase NifS [Bacillota bacterium]